jgi:hypothetical protein
MTPQLKETRARFVLSKIDQILAWEQAAQNERACAAGAAEGVAAGGLDEGGGVGKAGAAGGAALRLCNLVAQGANPTQGSL